MAVKKRQLEDSVPNPKSKKAKVASGTKKSGRKVSESVQEPVAVVAPEEIDFPRGGGTSFTPLEVKAIRAEAVKEADNALFAESKKEKKTKRRKSDGNTKGKGKESVVKGETFRVEHLNYKRLVPGMKILAQVISVQPLALIVSLPNQLAGHIPITHVSSELTRILESADAEEREEAEDDEESAGVPELSDIFEPSQYLRCVVTAVHSAGSSGSTSVIGRARDAIEKASYRVELSLVPEQVNEGVVKGDLKSDFTLSGSIKSIEDHGYSLNLGLSSIAGFLSFKEAEKSFGSSSKLRVGQIIDVTIIKLSSNGRICNVTTNPSTLRTSYLSEISNVTSILPGELVQCLITAVLPVGLNVQLLGYFDGTVDEFHLPPGSPSDHFKIGQKVRARVLYEILGMTPPRFALTLADHVIKMRVKSTDDDDEQGISIQEAYPIGTILEAVKVVKVESERGLLVETGSGVYGFIHISHVSDDHVPSLSASSGAWKLNSSHRARVTGYFPFDGLLQLSLRTSILEQKFMQVADVQVGEVIKGTIKKLTDSALFLSVSGNVDGVIFPNHFADIKLKHPQKRFKPGASIKCRILTVDPSKKRVALTAKKTLIESDLPIISQFEDAKVGMITHAVIFKVAERRLQIEFFNNVKGSIPAKEASEDLSGQLSQLFSTGKVVKVRIIAVDVDKNNIVASIRQAAANFKPAIPDISGAEVGQTVAGVIAEVHKEHAILTLKPTEIRALLSLKNLANFRNIPIAQLRSSLEIGEELDDLIVVSRNVEKGIVIVANRPKAKPTLEHKQRLSIDAVQPGQVISGRVLKHHRKGTLMKFSARIIGTLHPTDVLDDYEAGSPFPTVDTIIKAAVLSIDKEKKHLTLSTRPSRMKPEEHEPIVDREITSYSDLKPGDTVRGFIKNVAQHGLFVALGREVDARVQIKELFDEFVKDWQPRFQQNQLVKGRVLSIDTEKKHIELTFRSGDSSKTSKSMLTLADLRERQIIEGRVKKIEDYGLFIEINGSKLSGLCHKSELSDNKDADVTLALRSFREGDRLKALILSIDTKKRRISFGLKPSYFGEEDLEDDEEDENDGGQSVASGGLGVVGEDAEVHDATQQPADGEASSSSSDDEGEDAMAVDVDMDSMPFESRAPTNPPPVPSLQLRGGFLWNGSVPADVGQEDADESESESSEDSDEEDGASGKKKKKRRQVELDLTADMHTRAPESSADFERLLLGSPNSSYLWIQYMSFQLQLAEVDKAREIARRALQAINFREEQERLNVWIALLNLENVYGTDDSLETTFKDAARHNDSKTVHLRMASIFEQSEKFEKAEEQYKKTCKKFGQSSKVWTLFGEFYLKRGELEEARKLLSRSLQSLEKRKHLKTISKFAQLEYRLGDPERGKTIFEGIVDSHPKRWDLWSIYMDMEAGQKDILSVRGLFDRVLAHKMTSRKAKSFFKKWLNLERRIGDEEGAEVVKQKAIKWTQRAAAATTASASQPAEDAE